MRASLVAQALVEFCVRCEIPVTLHHTRAHTHTHTLTHLHPHTYSHVHKHTRKHTCTYANKSRSYTQSCENTRVGANVTILSNTSQDTECDRNTHPIHQPHPNVSRTDPTRTVQHTAIHSASPCNTIQHAATRCNTLQLSNRELQHTPSTASKCGADGSTQHIAAQ